MTFAIETADKSFIFANNTNALRATKLNFTTKRAQGFLNAYRHFKGETVDSVYKSPSANKLYAEYRILRDVRDFGGFGYRITAASCQRFTAMWKVWAEDNNTGELTENLIVETPENRYAICLRDC